MILTCKYWMCSCFDKFENLFNQNIQTAQQTQEIKRHCNKRFCFVCISYILLCLYNWECSCYSIHRVKLYFKRKNKQRHEFSKHDTKYSSRKICKILFMYNKIQYLLRLIFTFGCVLNPSIKFTITLKSFSSTIVTHG